LNLFSVFTFSSSVFHVLVDRTGPPEGMPGVLIKLNRPLNIKAARKKTQTIVSKKWTRQSPFQLRSGKIGCFARRVCFLDYESKFGWQLLYQTINYEAIMNTNFTKWSGKRLSASCRHGPWHPLSIQAAIICE
jgi:hypothetical protein